MRRFVYAPDVQAYIMTQEFGLIDVSEDIISGRVTRRVGAVSDAALSLQNPRKKYLKKIKPMDRIAIFLTRIHKPTLVFTGYIDRAPYDQIYPGPVNISASCTLKRLLHTYFDPGLPAVQRWLAANGWNYDTTTGNLYNAAGKSLFNLDISGGMGQLLRLILHDVGGWPIGVNKELKNTVHIMKLPSAFIAKTGDILKRQIEATEEQQSVIQNILRTLMTVDGVFSDPFGVTSDFNFESQYADTNPLPRRLAQTYKAKIYGPPFTLSGFAKALIDEAAKRGISLDHDQAQNAQTIFGLARKHGFTPRSSAGWVAASWPESKLHADAVNSDSEATGLFQLLSVGYYGPTGTLAQIVQELTKQKSNPQPGGDEAKNPTYNTLAIFTASSTIDAVNNSDRPQRVITDNYIRPSDAEKAANNYPNGDLFFTIAMAALTSSASSNNPDLSGQVGDVKVGSSDFFKLDSHHQEKVGYTFRIKSNPYGDDTMVFRAVGVDPKLDPDEISIYVPGAKGKGSPQAQAWVDHSVTLDTSFGGQPFPTSATASASASAIDPSSMTTNQLVGPGGNAAELQGLQPITLTALAFIQTQFGPFIMTSGFRSANNKPLGVTDDHNRGLAIDLVPVSSDGKQWTQEGIARTEALAKWAGWKPNNGGNAVGNIVTRWVGWKTEANHGIGNHIHISFLKGATPDEIPGANIAIGADGTIQGTGVQTDQIANIAQAALSVNTGVALTMPLLTDALEAQLFTGERALQNDVPLFEWIDFAVKAAGRQFQSMPNGDFFAFYPDYFNWSNEAPYFQISDIEILDLNIDVGDEELTTHVFTTADTMTVNGEIDISDKLASTVASVETAGTFQDFVNVTSDFDPIKFLNRYGARPKVVEAPFIKNSILQFMYGWMTFLEYWARQFYCNASFTFMPELYPGGLVRFASKDLTMYIQEVTHTFDRSSGFKTEAQLISPSTSSKSVNPGMVLIDDGIKKNTPGSRKPPANPTDSGAN